MCVTVMALSRRSPGSGHGVGVMLAQVVPLDSRSRFASSSRSLLRISYPPYMLVAYCNSTYICRIHSYKLK